MKMKFGMPAASFLQTLLNSSPNNYFGFWIRTRMDLLPKKIGTKILPLTQTTLLNLQ